MTQVAVQAEGHRVLIRPRALADPGAVTTVQLGLSGAVLVLDLLDPEAMPAAEVHDVDAASWWLFSVYGRDVAEAVVDARQHGAQRDATTADDVPLLDPVRRLGLALHLLRYWPTASDAVPVALQDWLLSAEAGSLAAAADTALDPAEGLAAELLQDDLVALAGGVALHHRRVDASAADEAIDGVLLAAARDALDFADPDADGYGLLAELVERQQREERAIRDLVQAVDAAWSAQSRTEPDPSVRRRARDAVLLGRSRGRSAERLAEGRQAVDPRAVRARVLATDDDAIFWEVRRDADGLRCDVTVAAAEDGELPATEVLSARVDHGGAVSVALLEQGRDDRGVFYTGTAWLDATAPIDDLSVTVVGGVRHADRYAPRPDPERRRDRDAIQALVAERLTRAHEGVGSGWQRPFAVENLVRATVPSR